MAVHDVLDDGQAKPGAAARPALLHVDAVETFGEARNVFGSDAGAMVAHGHFGEAAIPAALDLDELAGASILEGILDEVLQTPARVRRGCRARAAARRSSPSVRSRIPAPCRTAYRAHGAATCARSTSAEGRTCSFISMRDSESRSSIRRFMRSAWLRMRPRNRTCAFSSLLRGSLHGFDEARKRGERRAQFMAGIGHEIGAHALDLLLARQVAQHDHARPRPVAEGRDMGLETPLHRHAQLVFDASSGSSPAIDGCHGIEHAPARGSRRKCEALADRIRAPTSHGRWPA